MYRHQFLIVLNGLLKQRTWSAATYNRHMKQVYCSACLSHSSSDFPEENPSNTFGNRRKKKRSLHNRQLSDEEKLDHFTRLESSLEEDKHLVKGDFRHNIPDQKPKGGIWRDRFGTLAFDLGLDSELINESFSRSSVNATEFDNEEEEEPYRRLAQERWHTPVHYGRRIEKLGKKNKIFEAIQVLETTMLKEDRVMPNEYTFTVLIGVLGRAGYTKKAFQLYNRMKKIGIRPTKPLYTALFNACSNSPWPEDGLKRANNLWNLMKQKSIMPNETNYAAMIKAFGMCGDLLTAFKLVDEMSKYYQPTEETYAALLVASVSDKEAGLKHAIEVWRRMRKRHVPHELKHYNLLLKAIRDCGVGSTSYANTLLPSGDPNETTDTSSQVKSSESRTDTVKVDRTDETEMLKHFDEYAPWWQYDYSNTTKGKHQQKGHQNTTQVKGQQKDHQKSQNEENTINEEIQMVDEKYGEQEIEGLSALSVVNEPSSMIESIPVSSRKTLSESDNEADKKHVNILNPRVKLDEVISIGDMSTPQNRLELFGGIDGILSHMAKDKVAPDIKIFTQLNELIPPLREYEKKLLKVMDTNGVEPDTVFMNLLIRRRNLRRDFHGAKEILGMMSKRGLCPDIMTYGVIALGCTNIVLGLSFLNDMQDASIVPNIEIYRTLLSRTKFDFYYKIEILKSMKKHDVYPDKGFLITMERTLQRANENLVKVERNQVQNVFFHSKEFKDGLRKFRLYYKQWLMDMKVEPDPHPWQRYREPTTGPGPHPSQRYRESTPMEPNENIEKK